MSRLWTLSIAWTLLAGSAVFAREIFVDNQSGDDLQSGAYSTSTGGQGPVQSIGRALRIAAPGDVIVLADTGVPYRECVTIQGKRLSGVGDTFPLVIEGNGAILDGSIPIDEYAWERVARDLWSFRPNRKAWQVLLLDGQPAERVPVDRTAYSPPALKPLQWCLLEGRIFFRTEADRLPNSYNPSCAGHPVGVTIYDARHVTIRGLTVRGFALDGINVADKGYDVRLIDVIARDNGRAGVAVCGSSRATIAQSTLEYNHESQLRVEGWAKATLDGVEAKAETAPAILRDGPGAVVDGEPGP